MPTLDPSIISSQYLLLATLNIEIEPPVRIGKYAVESFGIECMFELPNYWSRLYVLWQSAPSLRLHYYGLKTDTYPQHNIHILIILVIFIFEVLYT